MNKLLALCTAVMLSACSGPQQQAPRAAMSLAAALSVGDNAAYRQADKVRKFVFPQDHGEHPGFKTEWWYFTGNVKTASGREFGYQFTIFRNAIKPVAAVNGSAVKTAHTPPFAADWDTSQVYMAHAALSDIANGKFYYDEQFSREALGLAGATASPLKVWLNQWSATGKGKPCRDCFAVELTVPARDFRLQIQLNNTHAMVLQGDRGLSAKGPAPGNASYYYSYTRLQTTGRITLAGTSYLVTGDSWFDHEWSSSALGPDQEGWDWFGLQLSDRSEIMLYRLRHVYDPDQDYYSGSLIHADGTVETLSARDIKIYTLNSWRSPATGVTYPSAWDIKLPGLLLSVTPKMPNQEVNTSIRYWEGAVAVHGTSAGEKIRGQGYVELTGYR